MYVRGQRKCRISKEELNQEYDPSAWEEQGAFSLCQAKTVKSVCILFLHLHLCYFGSVFFCGFFFFLVGGALGSCGQDTGVAALHFLVQEH